MAASAPDCQCDVHINLAGPGLDLFSQFFQKYFYPAKAMRKVSFFDLRKKLCDLADIVGWTRHHEARYHHTKVTKLSQAAKIKST